MPKTRVLDSLPEGEASGSEQHITVLDQGTVSGTSIEWVLYEDDVMELRGPANELREVVRAWAGINSSASSKRDDSTSAISPVGHPGLAPTTENR